MDDIQKMVEVVKIKDVVAHPNPKVHSLELAYVRGWQCVVQKGLYKKGDIVLYFAIDSILPNIVESKIFGENSKITLEKSRVRSIRIQKAISQGLIVPRSLFYQKELKVGKDVSGQLGVTKFEQKIKKGNVLHTTPTKKRDSNPNFKKVRKPQNIKNFPDVMKWKEVVITEKIHGTSFVSGYVSRPGKIKRLLFGEYEFCYRSMNNQLQRSGGIFRKIMTAFGFKRQVVHNSAYGRICKQYNLSEIIPDGYEIAGEIYGSGIQRNYAYGCKEGEIKLVVFGVKKDGLYLPFYDASKFVEEIGLNFVPVLFKGVLNNDVLKLCTNGKSVLDPKTQVREGCVIELLEANGETQWYGHPILKSLSDSYLMNKDNTDFH